MKASTSPDPHPDTGNVPSGIQADAIYDAGALGCGDGPLIRIAAMLRAMPPGGVLEVRSSDSGVSADLPAWCRMVGHTFLGAGPDDDQSRYFIRRKHD